MTPGENRMQARDSLLHALRCSVAGSAAHADWTPQGKSEVSAGAGRWFTQEKHAMVPGASTDPGSDRRTLAVCRWTRRTGKLARCIWALGVAAPGLALAEFSAFGGSDALGASGHVSGTVVGSTDVSAFDTRPSTATRGQRASILFGRQDPDKSVGSAGVSATAGFGWLTSSASASASWVPAPNVADGSGGGGWYADTGHSFSSGPRYTFFSDTLTVNAAGRNGQVAMAHASVTLTSALSMTLPNLDIGSAALERAGFGVEFEVATGAVGSWGEGGLSQATSHLLAQGGVGIAHGAAFSGGTFDELVVKDKNRVVYDGAYPMTYHLAFDIPIVVGKPFSLNVRLETGAMAEALQPLLAPGDLANTFTRYAFGQGNARLTWGGIDSITLTSAPDGRGLLAGPAQALTLTDFSVASGSGADYRHAISAVPEPASWAMWLFGLFCLTRLNRRGSAGLAR